jgi:hypothetical protein
MQIATNMKTAPNIHRKKSPFDADFFGPAEPSQPGIRHPDHWLRYKETFLRDADPMRFSVRRNGEDGWFPARGRQYVDGQLAKRWDRPLSSSDKELDAHLGGLHENGNLSWMGVFGGRYTSHYNVDVDNHEAKGKGYLNSRGRWVQVADLSVKYLKLVKVARETLASLDRPTVIVTSSRSLGLNIWQHTDRPYPGPDVFGKMTAYLEGREVNRHLNHLFPDPAGKWKEMEVFPMYGKDGKANRLQRLPFGHGSVTLSNAGIIGPWHEQVAHFLDPGLLPAFEPLVELLLSLYIEQFRAWKHSGTHLPDDEHELQRRRLDEIRSWLKAGCPVGEPPARKPTGPGVDGVILCCPAPSITPTKRAEPRRTPDWLSLPRERRVFYLATHGLPDKGSLNRSLYLLATHLLGLELLGQSDASEVAQDVLTSWCLKRHNGMSRRLDGVSLGPDVMRIISWAIAKASKVVGSEDWRRLREKKYAKPLRLRWLVCRQGPVSLYSPSQPIHDPSVIYCVSHSVIHDPASLKVQRLPAVALETIKRLAGRKPLKAVEFNVMFANFLDARGGKATVNREKYMATFLGYDNPSQWTKFKVIGEKAGIFRMTKPGQKAARSNEYELLIHLEDGDVAREDNEPASA